MISLNPREATELSLERLDSVSGGGGTPDPDDEGNEVFQYGVDDIFRTEQPGQSGFDRATQICFV